MAASDWSVSRKRTFADLCSSSDPTPVKYPKVASACSPPVHPSAHHKSTCSSTHLNNASRAKGSPFRSSPCFTSDKSFDVTAASSTNQTGCSSDSFPRYALGIPHLDSLLPFRDGLDLLHAYHQGVGWMQSPVDRTTLLETLEEAERHGADAIHPHRLACLLAALAIGDFFSPCFSSSPASSCSSSSSSSSSTGGIAKPYSSRGKIWFGVASACLAGSRSDAELIHNPTPDACSALYLMSTYLLCSNDEQLFHRSQGLTGLALILAKAILCPASASLADACLPSQIASPSIASHNQATPRWMSLPSAEASTRDADAIDDQDRLNRNRLLTDLIFHLRCQILTFASPPSSKQTPSTQTIPSLADLPELPSIQAIWASFGAPLYPSLDAYGSCYNPNIFHNWKLGLADLMYQVSILTRQAAQLEHPSSPSWTPCGLPAGPSGEAHLGHSREEEKLPLPDHAQIVKLDERIRRYHASLPPFLLLHKPLPIEMAGKVDEDELAQIICQRHMACSMVHRMLMALHRPWFLSAFAYRSRAVRTRQRCAGQPEASAETTSATSQSESDGKENESDAAAASPPEQPSPSAIFSLSAVLRSATWQTETFASATACAPQQALAWWQFTNNALAAAIVQATALLRLPCPPKTAASTGVRADSAAHAASSASHLHAQVRSDLDKNICSFKNVAKRCKLAAKALPFLQRVSSAIDLGICRSRNSATGQDGLQSIGRTDEVHHPPSSSPSTATAPLTDISTVGRQQSVPGPHTCNNTRIVSSSPSISNISSNSNTASTSTSNSNSIYSNDNNSTSTHQIPTPDAVHADNNDSNASSSPAPPRSNDANPTSSKCKAESRSADLRRTSSAKSELETIFGPLASGLELKASPQLNSPPPTQPLYRQSYLEPLPKPPTLSRSDPASSDDAGSSICSSEQFPYTPRARSLQLNMKGPAAVTPVVATKVGEAKAGEVGGRANRKEQKQASDLVLDCIRFWQPDTLALPAAD